MALFRRDPRPPKQEPAVPSAPPDGDSPAELRTSLSTVNRLINQSSGRLPGVAVVNARRVTDTLREIIATSDTRPLDVYAVITVQATLQDYLPTTLRSYLAVDVHLRETRRSSGRTPTQALLEQIDALQRSADTVLVATDNQDVDALMTQGSFLRTKYAASDLDL